MQATAVAIRAVAFLGARAEVGDLYTFAPRYLEDSFFRSRFYFTRVQVEANFIWHFGYRVFARLFAWFLYSCFLPKFLV